MEITEEDLKKRLLEADCPNDDEVLNSYVERIRNFTEEARSLFEEWYKTAKVPAFDVNGITPAFLRKFHNYSDISVVFAYDWLLKDPKEASRLLKKHLM